MFKSRVNTYGVHLVADHVSKGLRIHVGDAHAAHGLMLDAEDALKLYNYLGEVYGEGETETSKDKVDKEKAISKSSETGRNDEGNKGVSTTLK